LSLVEVAEEALKPEVAVQEAIEQIMVAQHTLLLQESFIQLLSVVAEFQIQLEALVL
jgi:hypothetical protein